MDKLIEFLSGKKTYLAAIALAIYAALAYWQGDIEQVELIRRVLEAFGLGFLRAGVAKI